MLKESNTNLHKRNKSELMACPPAQQVKSKKKLNQPSNPTRKRPTPNTKKSINPTLVPSLLNKSTKKVTRKQILVEDIEEIPEQQGTDDFFCFGKGYGNNKCKQVEPEMQEIIEVPDTGSYSQRNTDQDHHGQDFRENKQNIRMNVGCQQEIQDKFFRLSKNEEKYGGNDNTVALLSHRQANNCSRRSSNHSQRSQCSQTHSTMELSRQKSKLSRSKSRGKQQSKNQIKILKQKAAKMQKSIKMIWQCMGEIWQSNRVSKHIAQRNNGHLNDLSHRVLQNQKMLLDLKLEAGRKNKDLSFRG